MSENIHDKGYKRILSKKKNFLDMLTSFINEKWVEGIQEEQLQLIDKEFIPKDFKEKEADVIYRCKIDDNEIYFYVLLELQSSVDFTMPFRLLVYIIELLKRIFLDTPQEERERKDYRLPVILPIVLYNGADSWSAVRNFREYQSGFEMFGDHILDFQYILLNVNSYPEDELLELKNLISLIFSLDKKADINHLLRTFDRVSKIISALSKDAQIDLLDWIKDVLTKKFKGKEKEISHMTQLISKERGDNMTYAIERLIDEIEQKAIEKGRNEGRNEGMQEGRNEGMQEGRNEGMQEGMNIIIERMLRKGKTAQEISDVTDISLKQIISLKNRLEIN